MEPKLIFASVSPAKLVDGMAPPGVVAGRNAESNGAPLEEVLGVLSEFGVMMRFFSRLMGSSVPSSTKERLWPQMSRVGPSTKFPICSVDDPSLLMSEKHHRARRSESAYTRRPSFRNACSTSATARV